MSESVISDLKDDALSLAMRASAAASVDSGLLRRLRLRFLKESDASIEAAVWRSEAVESETGSGITFSLSALTELRGRLPATWVHETCDEIAAYHAGAPPLLLLEEQLVRHALALEPAKIEAALGQVLASLEQQAETRGPTILHWANEALPRLPAVAQRTAAAWALSLAAQREFEREILPGGPPPGFESYDLSAYLPETDVPVYVRVDGDELVFRDGSGDGERIDVPDTHPRVVVLDRHGSRTTVNVRAGAEARVPNTTYPLVLGDLRGNRWRVRAVEEAAHDAPVIARFLVIADLCLTPETLGAFEERLERVNGTLASAGMSADALLVAGGLIDGRYADDKEFLDRVSKVVLRLPDYVIVPDRMDAVGGADGASASGDGPPVTLAGSGYWFRDGTGVSSIQVVKDGYRIGIVGLNSVTPRPGFEQQLDTALKGDVPALYREELDAAILVTAENPRNAFGEKIPALDLFDAKLFGHGGNSTFPNEGVGISSFQRADEKAACACLVELTFEDGKLTRRRDSAVALDRIVGASDVAVKATPRKRGHRAMQRREIIRALRARKSVLVTGAQATGKTALIAELVALPWLRIAKVGAVRDIEELAFDEGDAICAELDPGVDVPVLSEDHTTPLLLESSVLPFHEPPALGPSWEVIQLGPLDRDDVLDALSHVDAHKRNSIATWLLEETGGDPWLIWRAIAGARIRGANDIGSHTAPLAQAAVASVQDIDDPAAIELLAALCKGPRWPVDKRAQWQLEYYGVAQLKEAQAALSSPIVGRVVTDDVLERLRSDALGDLADDPRQWVSIQADLPESWIAPVVMAIAHAGYGLQQSGDTLGPAAVLLERLRSAEWVRIGGLADVMLVVGGVVRAVGHSSRAPEGAMAEAVLGIPESLGPDQVYVHVSEMLEGRRSSGRTVSELLDEVGCYDAAFVTVRKDIARKASRRTYVAEVIGMTKVFVTDAEARRLVAAGARRRRGQRDPREQSTSDILAEDVELGRTDLGEADAAEGDDVIEAVEALESTESAETAEADE